MNFKRVRRGPWKLDSFTSPFKSKGKTFLLAKNDQKNMWFFGQNARCVQTKLWFPQESQPLRSIKNVPGLSKLTVQAQNPYVGDPNPPQLPCVMSDINKNIHKFQKFQNNKTISLEKSNIPINKNNNDNQFKLTLHSGLAWVSITETSLLFRYITPSGKNNSLRYSYCKIGTRSGMSNFSFRFFSLLLFANVTF